LPGSKSYARLALLYPLQKGFIMSKRSSCLKISCGCLGTLFALGVITAILLAAMGPQLAETFGETFGEVFEGGLEGALEKAKGKVTEAPVYTEALSRAEADPRVGERLGTPLTGGFPQSVSIVMSPRRHTKLEFTLSGPLGEGRLEVDGTDSDGVADLRVLRLHVGDEEIDLLQEPLQVPNL
jgi:hypothetical protein